MTGATTPSGECAGYRLKSHKQHRLETEMHSITMWWFSPKSWIIISVICPTNWQGTDRQLPGNQQINRLSAFSFSMNPYCFGTWSLTQWKHRQRFLFCSEDVRANSKVEVIEEEMNLPWNKSPAQRITVRRSALLVSGLLWPDLPFMTFCDFHSYWSPKWGTKKLPSQRGF